LIGGKFVPAPAIRVARVDGLRVILDLNSESYLILDEAASELWSVLVGEVDVETSFRDLFKRFDVDEERLLTELAVFANRCIAKGLLARREAVVISKLFNATADVPGPHMLSRDKIFTGNKRLSNDI
jgi:hypothetical protein